MRCLGSGFLCCPFVTKYRDFSLTTGFLLSEYLRYHPFSITEIFPFPVDQVRHAKDLTYYKPVDQVRHTEDLTYYKPVDQVRHPDDLTYYKPVD